MCLKLHVHIKRMEYGTVEGVEGMRGGGREGASGNSDDVVVRRTFVQLFREVAMRNYRMTYQETSALRQCSNPKNRRRFTAASSTAPSNTASSPPVDDAFPSSPAQAPTPSPPPRPSPAPAPTTSVLLSLATNMSAFALTMMGTRSLRSAMFSSGRKENGSGSANRYNASLQPIRVKMDTDTDSGKDMRRRLTTIYNSRQQIFQKTLRSTWMNRLRLVTEACVYFTAAYSIWSFTSSPSIFNSKTSSRGNSDSAASMRSCLCTIIALDSSPLGGEAANILLKMKPDSTLLREAIVMRMKNEKEEASDKKNQRREEFRSSRTVMDSEDSEESTNIDSKSPNDTYSDEDILNIVQHLPRISPIEQYRTSNKVRVNDDTGALGNEAIVRRSKLHRETLADERRSSKTKGNIPQKNRNGKDSSQQGSVDDDMADVSFTELQFDNWDDDEGDPKSIQAKLRRERRDLIIKKRKEKSKRNSHSSSQRDLKIEYAG